MRKQGSCLEKEIIQGTMPGARRRGRPRTAWMDNIKTWTGLSVEESITMKEDRDRDSTSMVWPSLGSRTARTTEQNRTVVGWFSSGSGHFCNRGVVGRVRVEWTASPTFFDRWGRLPQFFGLKLVQKLVNCCNWLLIETWCKIFSRYSRINVAAKASICCIQSHTNTCIAGQDQRPAVASFLTCMSVRVCRPELYLYYKPFV